VAHQIVTIRFFQAPDAALSFRFRGDTEALELWGVWRNIDAISRSGLQPNQVLGAAAAPAPALHLEGKRRSATEIVACVVGVVIARRTPSEAIAILKILSFNDPAIKMIASSLPGGTVAAATLLRAQYGT